MISARALTKRYGKTVAVGDLTFDVTPGVVTGFLGPNGSGKSTTMRMIMGLDDPELGIGSRQRQALCRSSGGRSAKWAPCSTPRPSTLPGARTTTSVVSPRQMTSRVGGSTRCSTSSDSTSVAHQRAGKYSLGMGQRLGIASALLGDPGVLLFDEPINGLDPEGIRWVRHLLRDLAAEGRTVFVSSHLINEMSLTAATSGRDRTRYPDRRDERAGVHGPERTRRGPGGHAHVEDLRVGPPQPGAKVAVERRCHRGLGDDIGRGRRAGRPTGRSPCTSSPPCGRRWRTPSWN